jgi:hypothetical protein
MPSKRRRIDEHGNEVSGSWTCFRPTVLIIQFRTIKPQLLPDLDDTPSHASTNHVPNTSSLLSRPRTRAQSRFLHAGMHAQRDRLPEGPPALELPAVAAPVAEVPVSSSGQTRQALPRLQHVPFRTEPNVFGLYRVYTSTPVSIPDAGTIGAPVLPAVPLHPKPRRPRSVSEIIAPCPNISSFYVQHNHWLGGSKSRASRNQFQRNVLQRPDFDTRDVAWVDLDALDLELSSSAKTRNPLCPDSEGWTSVPLRVQVPPIYQTLAMASRNGTPPPAFLAVSGLRARKLTDIMRQRFSSNNRTTFHYEPFESYWIPPGSSTGHALRTSDEMYSSPAMVDAHKEVQRLNIRDSECTLPRCVAGFMFASDAIQFGNFCNAKGWPIFAYFGNESKYERCKPFSSACHHLAHIPSVINQPNLNVLTN